MSSQVQPAPASTHATTKARALLGLLRAARLTKNLPLLLLLIGGSFTTGSRPAVGLLSVGLVTLLIASAFITHINILADAELDREKKPHLLRWLTADSLLMKAALICEPICVGVGLLALALAGGSHVALGLLLFTLLTTLYSYNFFVPSKAVACRLKVYWWGHFLVCQGAYMALWYAGHFCAEGSSWATFAPLLPVFLLVSLSEYSLFLSESAFDAREEKKFNLKTFATLLGRQKSSVLALFVWLVSFAGIAAYGLASAGDDVKRLILIAFVPAMLLRGAAAIVLAAPRGQEQDDVIRARLPDMVFFGSRILTLVALGALGFWAH